MCYRDSGLVAQQVASTYKAQNEVMAAYRDEVYKMAKSFIGYDIKHVCREDNMAADNLSKLGSDVYARVYSCRQCWASKCRGL
jgi:hypothetical protein